MRSGDPPDHVALNSMLRGLRLEPYHPFCQRVYRSLSWVKRASDERTEHEKFIFLWIAFNAAYAIDGDQRPDSSQERTFNYLDSMTRLGCRRIAESINAKIAGPIIDLMDNQFVFHEFWYSADDAAARREFESCCEKARGWLKQIGGDTLYGTLRWAELELLKKVSSRLSVLRNQLMHGSATESGFMNRRQVESGARILEVLVPTSCKSCWRIRTKTGAVCPTRSVKRIGEDGNPRPARELRDDCGNIGGRARGSGFGGCGASAAECRSRSAARTGQNRGGTVRHRNQRIRVGSDGPVVSGDATLVALEECVINMSHLQNSWGLRLDELDGGLACLESYRPGFVAFGLVLQDWGQVERAETVSSTSVEGHG